MNRTTVRCLAVAGLLTGTRLPAQASPPDSAARRAAMTKLAFLQGSWSGDAWASVGRGERIQMRQTESIRYAVGGQVLVVEGVGRRLVNGTPNDTVFHALGTIDWLPSRGYLMRSYALTGQHGEFPLAVTDSGFTWEIPVPRGRIRYTMQLTGDGAWDERGFYSADQSQRVQTFGMLLRPTRRAAR